MVSEPSAIGLSVQVLRRFHPRGVWSLTPTVALSIIGGFIEAAVLVIITAVAVGTTESADTITLGPIDAAPSTFLIAALAILLLSILVNGALALSAASLASTASLQARQNLITSFHSSSYQRKSQDRVATLQEALTTYVDRLNQTFGSITNGITGALNLATFAIAAVVVNLAASIAMAVIGLLLIAVLRPATKLTRTATGSLITQRRLYAESATESVLLAREQSVFGVTHEAGKRLRLLDAGVAAQFRRTKFLSSFVPKIFQSIAFILAVVGLFVLTSIDAKDLAAIGAVVLLLIRSMSYGQLVLQSLQTLSEHSTYMVPLMGIIDGYQASGENSGTTEIGDITEIELKSVTFGYGGDRRALQDIDLVIESGEAIGILGPSGAGKSTLVNLLLRLYAPDGGELLVNGVPLAEVDDAEWHRRTAIVPQEPRLLHGTIADNIRFLRPIDDAAVERAAEEAHVADFVHGLPLGFDSPVGELGVALSGGQRQRICIARALAGEPDLLILDEPTSALDGASESAIQETLERLKGRVTLVIVAHRLSTLSICDRLVVLSDGRAVAVGASDELAASSAYYRDALKLAGL